MITLQFSASDDCESRAIRWLTFSWASQVDVVFADDVLVGALPGRGVCLHSPPAGNYRRVERYNVLVPSPPIYRFLRRQLGKPFDWTAMFGVPRRDWRKANAWFSSELVAAAFEQAGAPLLSAPATRGLRRITPRDLLLSPRLRPAPLSSARIAVAA